MNIFFGILGLAILGTILFYGLLIIYQLDKLVQAAVLIIEHLCKREIDL